MMSIDALTAIENFASGIFSAGMEFLFTWGELLGIIGLIGHLMRARAEGRHSMGPGKFIAGIFICGMLVSLPSMINAGGTQMGFRADSFAPIAYVQPGSFGAAGRSRFCHERHIHLAQITAGRAYRPERQ